MAKTFEAQVADWQRKSEQTLRKIVLASALDVFNDAQKPKAQGGLMPIDLGNLRNSLVMELNAAPAGEGENSYVLAIANMQIGDVLLGGWSADYAMRVHFGFVGTDSLGRSYNQAAQPFRDVAAAKWPEIVAKNAKAAAR